ncbi:hypothetical protein BGZ92_001036 [Podila epicladia]|nr:hypothetical protein BGZ92_001036 [Podila epicladia]
MQQTLRGWARNDVQCKIKRGHLLALVLFSLLDRESSAIDQPVRSKEEILAPFGLCLANLSTDTKGQIACSHSPKPTIDYSEFFTILRQHHWYDVELEPFVRLIQIPEELKDMSVSEIEHEHTIEMQRSKTYTDYVGRGIHLLFLHHNANRITEMSLCVNWSAYYLPYANTLSHLCVLHFERKDNLTKKGVDGAVQFVRLVQQTFPGAHLTPKFTSWVVPYVGQTRETFYRPQIKLLEAFDRLHEIVVPCFITHFYTMAAEIGTDHLRSLQDYRESFSADEAVARDTFLQRCPSLLDLQIDTLRDKDSLAWIQDYPEAMKNLELFYVTASISCFYNTVLTPAIDIVHARGRTLLSVSIRSFKNVAPGTQLHTIGHWNLPAVKEIFINMMVDHCVRLGAFDQCPQLRDLYISLGRVSHIQELTYHTDIPLAPKWNLPQLSKLHLNGFAALMFNHGSLRQMPNLRSLELKVEGYFPQSHLEQSPLLLDYLASFQGLGPDGNQTLGLECALDWNWTLPYLTKLEMTGYASMAFTLDWLHCCPGLEELLISLMNHPRRVPLHSPMLSRPCCSSRLVKVSFRGKYWLEDQDLVYLLTILAPNVEELRIDSAHSTVNGDAGKRLLKLIMDAERTQFASMKDSNSSGLGEGSSNQDLVPLARLLKVMTRCTIGEEEAAVFRLRTVHLPKEIEEEYQQAGIRLYYFGAATLIESEEL